MEELNFHFAKGKITMKNKLLVSVLAGAAAIFLGNLAYNKYVTSTASTGA